MSDIFARAVYFITARTCLAIAFMSGYFIEQLDVRTAFLHGDIFEYVYVTLPPGLGICSKSEALKLKKGLYGLKQAPKLWHEKFSSVMKALNFKPLVSDECVYRRGLVWLLIYVGDIVIMSLSKASIQEAKTELGGYLKTTEMGSLHKFLGLRFIRKRMMLGYLKPRYVLKLLERFGMKDCRPMVTPMAENVMAELEQDSPVTDKRIYQELMGSLLFISNRTRPDVCSAMALLCRYMSDPEVVDWRIAERILRYLKGTSGYVLRLKNGKPETPAAFCDADWAGDRTDRRSTNGTVLQLGGTTVAWKSVKQHTVALFTTEAEFLAVSKGTKLIKWLRKLLEELDVYQKEITIVHGDNQGAVAWSNKGVRKAKHVYIRFNHVRHHVNEGTIELKYCPTTDMVADALTKPLRRLSFEWKSTMLRVLYDEK